MEHPASKLRDEKRDLDQAVDDKLTMEVPIGTPRCRLVFPVRTAG